MKTMNETDFAHNLSRVLDSLEHGGEEILITRNNQPVAKIIPGIPQMSAREAFSDLQGILTSEEGEAWIEDMRGFDRNLSGEIRDPWA